MPSFSHEGIIELFRGRTTLAPELLKELFAIDLPHYTKAISAEAKLTQIVPTEYDADLVVLLEDDRPVFGIVVEAQLGKDPDKAFSWPLYAMALRARHRIPVGVLVITPFEAIAEWARTIISTGPDNTFNVMVLGPSAVPRVTTEADAVRSPERAVLSAMAHGTSADGAAIATTAVLGLSAIDDKVRRMYYDLILVSVDEAIRKELEAMVQSGKYEYLSDFARKHIAEGVEQGIEKGMRVGRAQSLLEILAVRGIAVSPETEARIQVASEDEIKTWLARSISAADVKGMFGDD